MRKTKRDFPEDIRTLLSLVAAGRLFEVQAWIQKGKRLRPPDNDQEKFCPLFQAIETGFHSMAAVLLEGKEWEIWGLYGSRVEDKARETTECLRILLDAGGKWHPPWEKIRDVRRSLLRNSGKHIAQIVRMLVETPGAAEARWLVELCRTPTIRHKIRVADSDLLDGIDGAAGAYRIAPVGRIR